MTAAARSRRSTAGKKLIRHGHVADRKNSGVSPTYQTWCNMLNRCGNPNATQYSFYGGRGVAVCERWMSFVAFLEDVGERPSRNHSLDRFPDKAGNYEPGNVRWATRVEQCRNRRSTRAVVRSDGQCFASMAEAAEQIDSDIRNIWAVCNGKSASCGGFGWMYA